MTGRLRRPVTVTLVVEPDHRTQSHSRSVGPPPPQWPPIGNLGSRAAAETIHGTAAPVLAGFSATIATVVVTDSAKFMWPGAAAFCAVSAFILMASSIQVGAAARAHQVTPTDYAMWFEDSVRSNRDLFVREMAAEHASYERIARWARRGFNGGLVLLYSGVGTASMPLPTDKQWSLRVAAGLCAYAAAAVEASGAVGTEVRASWHRWQHERRKSRAGQPEGEET